MMLRGPEGRLVVEGKSGKLLLPVGEYRVDWAFAFADDPKGGRWSMALGLRGENCSFHVAPGKETRLRVGGPLRYSIRKRQDYGRVIAVMYDPNRARDVPDPDPRAIGFDLNVKDAFGNLVSAVRRPDGKRPPPPTLKISNLAGNGLASCSFEYG